MSAKRLWLFGGRSVTRALIPLVPRFRIVVVEHRETLLDHVAFSRCERRSFGPDTVEDTLTDMSVDDFAVVMTRDHPVDALLVDALLRRSPFFVGMMGRRDKVEGMLIELRKVHDRRALACFHAPVGLAIGAQTDAEIALSIAAQLIAAANGAHGGVLSIVGRPPGAVSPPQG
ncbi:MAG: XdhC family protein [Myxococcota bacterium]